ncbi:hypothetical protein [Bradyrhizobium nanningense]|uniref:hypothetical protein n=1 Tax=Bradyrhizobium nanningense TaxID=1325118 RepID=UPI001008C0BF|nr:hypothetical protein [Bradyrhizobium nanningense]
MVSVFAVFDLADLRPDRLQGEQEYVDGFIRNLDGAVPSQSVWPEAPPARPLSRVQGGLGSDRQHALTSSRMQPFRSTAIGFPPQG